MDEWLPTNKAISISFGPVTSLQKLQPRFVLSSDTISILFPHLFQITIQIIDFRVI